jgi:hypothetical protein
MSSLTPLLPSETRSVAILADIHGNIRALDAVLDDIADQDIDAVVCNGDLITGSAHSVAVVQHIRQLGIPCTRGNHERYLQELADPGHAKWGQANWAPVHYVFRTLSAEQRQWLIQLPDTLWLCDGETPLVMAHAAPGRDAARVTAHNTEDDWLALFADLPDGVTLVGSHLHWYWRRRWRGNLFVRTPSAGLSLDGDRRAGYVILRREEKGWSAEQRRVKYDLADELAAFRQSDYYQNSGVIAELFWEELRTARWWILPFFRHLRAVSAATFSPDGTGIDAETLQAALQTFDHAQFPDYDPDASGNHR